MVAGSPPSLEPFGLLPRAQCLEWKRKVVSYHHASSPSHTRIPVLNLVLAHVFCVMTQYPETMEDCVLAESLGQV